MWLSRRSSALSSICVERMTCPMTLPWVRCNVSGILLFLHISKICSNQRARIGILCCFLNVNSLQQPVNTVSGKVGTAPVKNLQLSRKIYHKTTMSTQHLCMHTVACITLPAYCRSKQMKTCHKAESRFLRRGCNDGWHDTKYCQTQGQVYTHRVTNLLMLLKLICATKIDIESGFVQLSSQLVSCSLIVDAPGVQGA